MKDFSALVGKDIRDGLKSVRLSTETPDAPKPHLAEIQEGIERRAGKRALADLRFAQATGMSVEHLAANRASSIAAPISTPGQAQGRGTGIHL